MREHGTYACYAWGPEPGCIPGRGCRCDECREAVRLYMAAKRQRDRNGQLAYVDATEARQHLDALRSAGVGLKTIARRSGVPHGSLSKLMYGQGGRGPSKRIRHDTAQKLLAVKVTDAADGAQTDAAKTWRTIAELQRRGWTKTAIAKAIGQSGPGLQLGRRYVTHGNARAIAALLDAPVPPRRTRWGTEVHSTFDPEQERRDAMARRAAADTRAAYRAKAKIVAADDDEQPIDYELPDLFTGAGAWMARGLCRRPEHPSWIFFADHDAQAVDAAKAICASCNVRTECLAAGQDEQGVWGGLTSDERAMAVAS